MDNPLLPPLRAAKQASTASPQTVSTHLRAARSLLTSHPNPSLLVTRTALELMNRLSKVADYAAVSEMSLVYALMGKAVAKNETVLHIDLANEILLLADQYKGSDLAFQLTHTGLGLLVDLLKSGRITPEQRLAIQSIVNKSPRSDLEAKLSAIEQDLKSGNLFSLHRLVDFLSSTASLREQLDLFGTKVFSMLNVLQGQSDLDMLVTLFKLVDQIVFQMYYSVSIPDTPSPQLYINSDARLLTENENCFYSAVSALKLLAKGGMTKQLIRIIRRLWTLYPGLRANLYELVEMVLGALAQEGGEGLRGSAAAFLYWVRHSSEVEAEFRTKLDNVRNIDALTKMREYCSDALSQLPDTETSINLERLQVFAGYPIAASIQPGERFNHVIDIPIPGSILVWAFATEYCDISYTITLLTAHSEVVLKQETRVQTDSSPVMACVMITEAGFVRLQWDNSFSWFREKQLRYRIAVLRPVEKQDSIEPHLTFATPIDVVCRDEENEKGEENACYDDPDADILEIGVHVAGSTALLKCKDIIKAVDASQLREGVSELLTESLKSMTNPPKYRKLGILSKSPSAFTGLTGFGTVAVARDVDALAFLSQKSLKTVHTLIAVVEEEGLRSAVMYRGKLLVSEMGQPLGDLSRLNVESLSEGIALLLNSFGPAVVILYGKDVSAALPALCDSIKPHVPLSVWQRSVVRESVLGPDVMLEAASKLNLLQHFFKHSF